MQVPINSHIVVMCVIINHEIQQDLNNMTEDTCVAGSGSRGDEIGAGDGWSGINLPESQS